MSKNSIPDTFHIGKGITSLTPFTEEVSHCFQYDSNTEMFRAIFRDNFFKIRDQVPPYVVDTVEKMINCQNMSIGYTAYQCPHCLKYKTVAYTCKCRFCPSCGNIINMQRCNSMAEKMINKIHRQGVFTIPDILRDFVYKDRELLHFMAQAATETIETVIYQVSPVRDPLPGIIWVIHTFSRSSEWNPHIHCIFTMGGITKYGKWFPLLKDIVIYEKLRLVYQDILLKKFRKRIGPSFDKLDKQLRLQYPKGFYVRAKPPAKAIKNSPKKLIKYLGRYLGRPCIASSRIDGYNGQYVYIHYIPHNEKEDDPNHKEPPVYEKLTVTDFMLRVTDHIPEPNFQMIGYSGIYANVNSKCDRVTKAFNDNEIKYLYSPAKHDYRVSQTKWRNAYNREFQVDPLECKDCNVEMVPLFCKYKGLFYEAAPQNGRRKLIKPPPGTP